MKFKYKFLNLSNYLKMPVPEYKFEYPEKYVSEVSSYLVTREDWILDWILGWMEGRELSREGSTKNNYSPTTLSVTSRAPQTILVTSFLSPKIDRLGHSQIIAVTDHTRPPEQNVWTKSCVFMDVNHLRLFYRKRENLTVYLVPREQNLIPSVRIHPRWQDEHIWWIRNSEINSFLFGNHISFRGCSPADIWNCSFQYVSQPLNFPKHSTLINHA